MYLSKEALTKMKNSLLVSLKAHGVERVVASYEGGGDSGCVEGIEASPLSVDLEAVQVTLPVIGVGYLEGKWQEVEQDRAMSLRDAVMEFTYAALRAHYPGWENNEGGRGEVTIDVEGGAARLDHTVFYTDSNDYAHDL